MENKLQMVLHGLLCVNMAALQALDFAYAVTAQLLLRCCSKCGCKKTFDLRVGLANIIHTCGPAAPAKGQRVAVWTATQTYQHSEAQSVGLGLTLLPLLVSFRLGLIPAPPTLSVCISCPQAEAVASLRQPLLHNFIGMTCFWIQQMVGSILTFMFLCFLWDWLFCFK